MPEADWCEGVTHTARATGQAASRLLRAPTPQEIKATTFIGMAIESASGKIPNQPVRDEEKDYAVPAWTTLLPIHQVLGEIGECPRQLPGVGKPPDMAGYAPGRRLDEVMPESYRTLYPEET